jgi:hypothetical protein
MNRLHLLSAIFSMLFTIVATVTMLVFCMAAGANASPDSIRRLKIYMVSFSLLSLLCLVAAGLLLYGKKTGWSAGIALAPSILMGITLILKLIR